MQEPNTFVARLACACALACLCAMWCAAATMGADWPQWGGHDDRNAVSQEKGLPESFVPGEKDPQGGGIKMATTQNVKWAARLGGGAYGNPTVAAGRVFVGTDDQTLENDQRLKRVKGGLVKCFDEATGKLLWQLATPPRINMPKEYHYGQQQLGVCSSPTVDGDRVYVVTPADEVLCLDVRGQANGNDGPFLDEGKYMVKAGDPPVAVAPADGDIIWRYSIIDELKVIPHDVAACSILVHGDFLYLSTSNGVDHAHEKALAPNAPAIIVLNKKTGQLAAFENEGISKRMWHTQWSPPSLGKVGDKTLVFFGGTDGFCYAFEALKVMPAKPVAMTKVWSYDCNPPEYRLTDGKPKHYMSGDKRRKDSPNKNDGAFVGPSEVIATPVFYKNRIYVAIGQDPLHGRGKGLLHCIDATKTGDITQTGRIWTYDGLDRTISNATIAAGLLYIPDIVGRLHCLDADTGKCYWVYETNAETWGTPLAADGRVYLGTQKAFFVFAAGKEAKFVSRIPLGAPSYCTPIAANGVLYVASHRYLWAVQQQKKP
jgi:outer membrane protein assembly factor BamB